ncbi:MAG: preprotein translocase subunit YajC [Acidimicrobiia bacterium]|nr:MAG: preprotein translocase subunit YajC [Acidimicrobiia bacterium]
MSSLLVLAQAEPPASPSVLVSFAPYILLFVVFYFLLIRPNRRRQAAQQNLLSSLEVGDEIVTLGGIHGRIRSLDDDTLVLTVEDGSYFRLERGRVSKKIVRDE